MIRAKKNEKHVNLPMLTLLAILLPLSLLFSACSPIQAVPGYSLSLFASGNASYYSPDGIAVDQKHIFIDYVNDTKKDGSDHKTSTVVEYDMHGQVLQTFSVSGHSDGLRVDPTHRVWALSNENANPVLTIINPDPKKRSQKEYQFCPTAHGGGYDDLYFLSGQYPFISASNPTLDKNGKNNSPSVYRVTSLVDENPSIACPNGKVTVGGNPGTANVTPILKADTKATDIVTNATVPLNEIDPDSLSEDAHGDLVLVNEDGNEVVFISHPGPQQKVSRLRVGAQLDDVVWIPSARGRGRLHLLVVDAVRNQTYWMDAAFKPGTVYSETTSVQSVVEQLDPNTGIVTTVATGFLKPTGLVFVPN